MGYSIDPEAVLNKKITIGTYELDEIKSILFAISIGFSENPTDRSDQKYTHKKNQEFQIFPTILATSSPWIIQPNLLLNTFAKIKIPQTQLLHAGAKLILYHPLVKKQKLEICHEIDALRDVGKATFIRTKVEFIDEQRNIVANYLSTVYALGLQCGGFKSKEFDTLPQMPELQPTRVIEYQTARNLALLYRLNGDFNPLHVDLDEAQNAGYSRPILHGLCFYGIAARLITKEFADNDSRRLKVVQANFTSFVYPGDRLIVKCWQNGNYVLFAMETAERGIICQKGIIEFLEAPTL